MSETGEIPIAEQLATAIKEGERLRAELAAERMRADEALIELEAFRQELAKWVNYWRYADLKAVTAERDALRAELAALRVGLDTKHQQYVEANEARIDANDALGNIRGLLWDVDEELAGGGHLRDGRLRRRVHSAIKNIGKLLENGEQYE